MLKTFLIPALTALLLTGCNSATTSGGGFGFNDVRNLAGTAAGGVGGGMLANSLTKNSKWNKWAIGAGAVAGSALGNNIMNSLDSGDAAAQQNAMMQQQQMAMMQQQNAMMAQQRQVFLSTNPAVMPSVPGYAPPVTPTCQQVQTQMGVAWACPQPNGTWRLSQ